MADREKLRRIIEDAYDARRRDDLEKCVEHFHEDILFRFAANPETSKHLPVARNHHEVCTTLADLMKTFTFLEQEFVNTMIEDDRACVHSRTKVRYNVSGATTILEIVDLWRFKEGKVVEFVEFFDTAMVNQMVAESRPAAS